VPGLFATLLLTFFFTIVNGVDEADIPFCLHKMKFEKLSRMFCWLQQMNSKHMIIWCHEIMNMWKMEHGATPHEWVNHFIHHFVIMVRHI
jgi:hypothetical protein